MIEGNVKLETFDFLLFIELGGNGDLIIGDNVVLIGFMILWLQEVWGFGLFMVYGNG